MGMEVYYLAKQQPICAELVETYSKSLVVVMATIGGHMKLCLRVTEYKMSA